MLSQIHKLAQIHRYMVLNFKKGLFFSQHKSFDVDQETNLDNGELDSNNEEDIADEQAPCLAPEKRNFTATYTLGATR